MHRLSFSGWRSARWRDWLLNAFALAQGNRKTLEQLWALSGPKMKKEEKHERSEQNIDSPWCS
jgi:hypothetical protein